MRARVNSVTKKILSIGEGRYPTDSADIIIVDINKFPDEPVEYYLYDAATRGIARKLQTDIDAIDLAAKDAMSAKAADRIALIEIRNAGKIISPHTPETTILLILHYLNLGD